MDSHHCAHFDVNKMNAVTIVSGQEAAAAAGTAQDRIVAKRMHSINPHRCSYEHCKKGEIHPNICRYCQVNFCLKHRLQDSHNCAALTAKKKKTQTPNANGPFLAAKSATAAQEMRNALASSATPETCASAAARAEGQTNIAAVSRLLRIGGK